jgi:transposase InsO family protein
MAYTQNPHVPKVRWEAVKMVRSGKSTREVARYFGYNQSSVVRWVKKAELLNNGPIPTLSSRPYHSPKALSFEVVDAILKTRLKRNRCGEVIHQELVNQGVLVSLSSVQRTLGRGRLLKKRSPWKRPHDYTQRPEAKAPGSLIQIDTIHLLGKEGRLYIYTLIDLYSRFTYAEVSEKISAFGSVEFVRRAQVATPFAFQMLQTDHGSEFSISFTHGVQRMGMKHRHSRVRQSNDNAHIERFNRSIQEECLDFVPHQLERYAQAIREYLPYYNTERLHLGIHFKTPLQMLEK